MTPISYVFIAFEEVGLHRVHTCGVFSTEALAEEWVKANMRHTGVATCGMPERQFFIECAEVDQPAERELMY